MKWSSAISSEEKVETALENVVGDILCQLGDEPASLCLVFLSHEHLGAGDWVLRTLSEFLPDALIAGCSAQSVIGAGVEVEQGPGLAVTAAVLPGVDVHPFSIPPAELQIWGPDPGPWRERIGVPADSEPAFILLGDPFTGDAQKLIAGLDLAYPSGVTIGGLAGGSDTPGGNRLYLGSESLDSGFIGIALTGNIRLEPIVAQGCRPIGQPMFVTRCEENNLIEIDGRSPVAVIEGLFAAADKEERELFRHSLFIGIQMRPEKAELARGDFLVRNLVGSDPETGSLAVGALLEERQVVQFQLRDGQAAGEDLDARLAASRAAGVEGEGALLFSCVGRGAGMYGRPNHDSEAFARHFGGIPLAGFFGNGELGPVDGISYLHGYTSVFGVFRPRDRNRREKTYAGSWGSHARTLTAQNLNSGILASGSSLSVVKVLAPASLKWKGMKTEPGWVVFWTLASRVISPRREAVWTQSPCEIPSFEASTG